MGQFSFISSDSNKSIKIGILSNTRIYEILAAVLVNHNKIAINHISNGKRNITSFLVKVANSMIKEVKYPKHEISTRKKRPLKKYHKPLGLGPWSVSKTNKFEFWVRLRIHAMNIYGLNAKESNTVNFIIHDDLMSKGLKCHIMKETYEFQNIVKEHMKKPIITMIDNKGNKWEESESFYQGYGVFGGKDIFQLLAEMNSVEDLTGNPELDREKGIDLFYSNKKNIIYPNLLVGEENSNAVWANKKLELCPNQGF